MIWDYGVLTKRKYQGEGKSTHIYPFYSWIFIASKVQRRSRKKLEKQCMSPMCWSGKQLSYFYRHKLRTRMILMRPPLKFFEIWYLPTTSPLLNPKGKYLLHNMYYYRLTDKRENIWKFITFIMSQGYKYHSWLDFPRYSLHLQTIFEGKMADFLCFVSRFCVSSLPVLPIETQVLSQMSQIKWKRKYPTALQCKTNGTT